MHQLYPYIEIKDIFLLKTPPISQNDIIISKKYKNVLTCGDTCDIV